ncbi:glycosyltransferase family 4 protein [Falsiroseomonas sp.]|uniref:glycosyltransferase family 4 protein n=1 Tax=Falsiroseomonas sp. TaxID=2870721 RepID=UPI0034A374E5
MSLGMAPHRLERLLVALPSTRMGGTERHTMDLARRLAARGGMAVEVAAEPDLHPALLPLLGPGVALRAAAIGWEAAPPEARATRQAAAMRALVAEVTADAAFIPLPWPDAGHGMLPVLADAGLPRLILLHLAPDAPPPAAVPALGLAGAVLAAVSAPLARRAALAWGVPEDGIALLANPAPAPRTLDRAMARAAIRAGLGLPPGAKLVLFVGRLEEIKGADLLPYISDRLDATLAIAGDGPLREVLEDAAVMDRRGLIRVVGPLADPTPWYPAADAVVMPSRLEGVPLVFLEAAAHRCPVVASAAALEGLGEWAPRLARIAATPDSAGLAAAVAAVLADPAAAAPMIEAAAAHAARQTPDAALQAALGLLRMALLRAVPPGTPQEGMPL